MHNEILLHYNGKIRLVERRKFIYGLLRMKAITTNYICKNIYDFMLEDIDKTIGMQVYKDGEIRVNLKHDHYEPKESKFCEIITNQDMEEELNELFKFFQNV